VDLQLTDKRAIVTGGSRGIGKAIARALAREGVDIVLAARDETALQTAASEIASESGRRALAVPADTGSDESVRSMVARALALLGGVDILVNCAAKPGGQGPVPALEQITEDLLWEDINVKVMGYLRCAREVAPHMKAAGWGRIVNISGLAARQSGSTIGSIRNVAVAALTKNLADELGPWGINVTVVHPGLTRTEKTPAVVAARARATGRTPEEVEAELAGANSVRRLISADDIAAVVAFLTSPRAVAINGDAIAAGGGAGRAIHY
jgi:NAD(P)-dependent dehydrogenase (short-subunit alcohol dehydrogenase family)